MESSLRLVAITNCPAGIAHTYMVAEALEQKARSLGHTIKIETQGASGVENRLTQDDIAAADYVILATGRGLSGDDRARFAGKKVYEIAISQALKNIDQISHSCLLIRRCLPQIVALNSVNRMSSKAV